MKKLLIAILILAVVIAASACVAVWCMYTAFRPTVIVQKVAIDFPSDTTMALLIDLEIYNQSQIPLTYAQVDYRVSAGGMELAQGTLNLRGKVDAQKAALLQLPVRVNLANLKELQSSMAGQKTELTIAGSVYLDLKIINLAFPFSFVRATELQGAGEPFTLVIKGLQVTGIAPDALGLAVQIELANKSDKPVSGMRGTYSVSGNKQLVLQGTFTAPDMPALGTSTASVPLTIQTEKLTALARGNKDQPVAFLIEGDITTTVKSRTLRIPFSVTKEIVLIEKPFDVSLKKFRIIKLGFKECVYAITLDVKNLMPDDIKDVVIEGPVQITEDVTVTVLNKNITLPQGKTTQLQLETQSRNRGLIKLLWNLMKMKRAQGSIDLKLKGQTADGTVVSSSAKATGDVEVDSSAVQKENE